ncbi:major facilitator superfamily protein [Hirsutella rhossiliensis]|uniref:Sugar transporter domain-containing protein n=1 Tax=Hirsutella rhossiliensis TaxID=111463 RepID=A0A9P8SG01_9HYPO|nr:sugar transporter domain-containing protein [Hirsutella rhossiliensis]KAH0961458.1 sugar transporter domain-containing protein [Hirsutella rhossiliensis]
MRRIPALAPGSRRLYALCIHFAVGASIWGYNIGVLSSVLVHPGWRAALRRPSASQRGAVTAVYYLGTLLSYVLLAHPLADWLGRRRAAIVGSAVLCVGAAFMAGAGARGASALGLTVAGRLVCGVGVGVVSTTVPLYQSEISPAKERGKFVTMNHIGFITGLATGLWVGYGMTFWTGPHGKYWGWRVSILLQFVPAIVFVAGLFFVPETPRWLVQKGKPELAGHVLDRLREGTCPPEAVARELAAIRADVEDRPGRDSAALALFRRPLLRARLWRAFALQFMAQLCGATAMKYYLPTLLRALGLSTRLALMAGAIEMTAKIGMTVVEMWAIDALGRRACLVGGCLVMGVSMLINGALPLAYPNNANKAADAACIAFIFIYAMGYSLGLGPAAWVYSSEIFPTPVRARGLNLAASGGAIGSIIVAQIWPVGVANLGSRIYFFFMAVNLVCAPIIWLLYPETKGRALEDMDDLFGKSAPRHPAALSDPTMAVEDRDRRHRGNGELTQTSSQDSAEEGAQLLP